MAVIGVHGMLSGTASMDFGGAKNAGIAVGIIDGFVYLGTGLMSFTYAVILPKEQLDAAGIEKEIEGVDISEPEARARSLKRLGPILGKVDDELAFTEYARFVADRLRIDIDAVFGAVGRRRRRGRAPSASVQRSRPQGTLRTRIEREFLRAVLADAHAAGPVDLGLLEIHDRLVEAAFERLGEESADVVPRSDEGDARERQELYGAGQWSSCPTIISWCVRSAATGNRWPASAVVPATNAASARSCVPAGCWAIRSNRIGPCEASVSTWWARRT